MAKLIVTTFGTASALTADSGSMREVFDDLTQFGVQLPLIKYPDAQFKGITDCMSTAGDTLYPSASDAAWTGWTQFGIQGGAPDDQWKLNNSAPWMEYDPRNLTYKGHHIPVIEPCNTVSNLAYYRIVPEMCGNRATLSMDDGYVNAIIQGFSTLGMGSSFMHGSRTRLGGAFDNIPISVIAYNYFQLMTSSLVPAESDKASVLHELSDSPRAYDGRELAKRIHTIPLNYELDNWLTALNALDRPQYYFTFGAIIVNCLSLVAPAAITDKLIPPLMSAFHLSDEVQKFLLDTYIPTIRGALTNVHPTLSEKVSLVSKFAGTIIKLLYAFTWQEQVFVYKAIYDPTWNLFGALLIPSVNSLGNRLTGYSHPDASIQAGDSIYPGQAYCNVKATAPHAKWHEQSANGLMDLGYLADAVKVVIEAAQARGDADASDAKSSDVLFSLDVIDGWVADLKAESWSEGYVVRQAFGTVIKGIATDMDKCATGSSDGNVTWEDLTCYLGGISSVADFIDNLFDSINKLYKPSLSSVHSTPAILV